LGGNPKLFFLTVESETFITKT